MATSQPLYFNGFSESPFNPCYFLTDALDSGRWYHYSSFYHEFGQQKIDTTEGSQLYIRLGVFPHELEYPPQKKPVIISIRIDSLNKVILSATKGSYPKITIEDFKKRDLSNREWRYYKHHIFSLFHSEIFEQHAIPDSFKLYQTLRSQAIPNIELSSLISKTNEIGFYSSKPAYEPTWYSKADWLLEVNDPELGYHLVLRDYFIEKDLALLFTQILDVADRYEILKSDDHHIVQRRFVETQKIGNMFTATGQRLVSDSVDMSIGLWRFFHAGYKQDELSFEDSLYYLSDKIFGSQKTYDKGGKLIEQWAARNDSLVVDLFENGRLARTVFMTPDMIESDDEYQDWRLDRQLTYHKSGVVSTNLAGSQIPSTWLAGFVFGSIALAILLGI